MLIDRHIAYLLWTDGFVSVPGLGAFSVAGRSAAVEGNAICAPSATVSFDATLDTLGGDALINSVSRQKEISRREAEAIVENDVHELRRALVRGEKVDIYGMGTLSVDDSGITVFDYSGRFVTSSWLEALAVEPLQAQQPADAETAKNDAIYEERRLDFVRSLQRTASSAAAIAVFALLAFIFAQLPVRRNAPMQMASIGMENAAPVSPVDEVLLQANETAEPVLVLVLNTPPDGTAPAKQRRAKSAIAAEQSTPGRYCLIVASLASKADAERYIAANSTADMPLQVLENAGRWRVYALSAPAISELAAAAKSLDVYERYPSAWICRR